ncbi:MULTISPECIES: DUF5518 domain-containing protein [unclassified Haladaptatus]|uniref:DUF5518 domain-containing protein n=1 Tax=unclassified Haladaptatus TaxID=2622732 RepID=UPI0023E7DAC3|nr:MULTISPECIES: DUF5518 domain-containing protein [unclassified Haladaptatus]
MVETTVVQSSSQQRDGILLHALIGAVLMFVLSFIPLSPVLGGAAAGYLHKHDGVKVGALAGLFAAIPVVAVVMFLVTFLTPVVVTQGNSIVGPLVGFGIMGFVLLLLVGLYTVGLGALGGYIGVYFSESRTAT